LAISPPESPAPPAFGQADLSNCEREQIHLAGCVQPHGFLLVVDEPELRIVQASANAASESGVEAPLLGRGLDELPGDLAEHVRRHLGDPLHEIPVALRCRFGEPPVARDCSIHRPPEGGLVLELEPAGRPGDLAPEIESAIDAIRSASTVEQLGDETARIFREIAGYDRAMVYRFDEAGHGEVLSERRRPDLESFLGQRYPASDIPQIARRLYIRNRVRVLVDVDDDRVPIEPRRSPLTGEELDMSLCSLRAMSPIHVEYLQNMGVAATLVASLVVDGQLWGLVACHHYSGRSVHYEVRAVCELLAEAVATRIAALESFAQAQAELEVRRLEQRMAEAVTREGDWRTALFDGSRSLLQPLKAGGAALLLDDEIRTVGEVPGTEELRAIGRWLDRRGHAPVYATKSLGGEEPAFAAVAGVASGLLAAPISHTPGEYLLWFRPAQVRTITWGGNPFKPFVVNEESAELSPRRSFAKWHQQVEGTCEPWAPADLAAAKLIGETVADIVLQFRSVRVLIAQDQLATVRSQVRDADHPVVIADREGRILLSNEAWERLLPEQPAELTDLSDLAALFTQETQLRPLLDDLVGHGRSFRGEFELRAGEPRRPLRIRADPVIAAPSRVLGHVVFVTDQSERRAAAAARRRFQEALVSEHPIDRTGAGHYRHLLSSVLGNAQLAALEITDGVDPTSMPGKLENVRASVQRTAELIDLLAGRAAARAKKGGDQH